MKDRLRWELYYHVCKLRRVCPANAHAALIWRTRSLREMRIDVRCLDGNEVCWCGKLRQPEVTQ